MSSGERHLSADAFLNLGCHVEHIVHDYCATTGCPAAQGVEALLSAAAHYALWSQQTETFKRVAGKLSARIDSVTRNNPGFYSAK
jgi:hypothetical protein